MHVEEMCFTASAAAAAAAADCVGKRAKLQKITSLFFLYFLNQACTCRLHLIISFTDLE